MNGPLATSWITGPLYFYVISRSVSSIDGTGLVAGSEGAWSWERSHEWPWTPRVRALDGA